ncbi:MAG: hypothetical protein KKD36_02295 [Bacteroidetes bacterium]|nr:hypothetical protein [Bacteroidota bacterium]
MKNNHLLSYAILNVNEQADIDYYDNFVPFIKETLRTSGKDIISANELKSDVKATFDLELPINVVNTILKRRLRPQGYITYSDQKYVPNYERLEETSFTDIRNKMLEKHNKLVNEFVFFAKENYEYHLSKEDAEIHIQKFIEKNYIQLLENEKKSEIKITEENNEQIEVILAKFILLCKEENLLNFNYLIDIVKGTMLANSLYYTDLETIEMKFKGTEIYFDSTFIIYALGLAGEARREPCIELITMLRKSKAILKVFRHNIEEIGGILEGCKNNLAKGKLDFHGTVSNFLDKGYSESDIDRIIYALEDEVEKGSLKFKIQENVLFDNHKYVIAEKDLEEQLKSNMRYTRQAALDKDVQSVSAIMRLRKGEKSLKIEKSRAIFVTTNNSLVTNVTKFFLNEEMPRYIPPVLHDSIITNLVWLKMPGKGPDLPIKRVIAECYAALAPKEHLWKRYIETLNIYEATNEITKEDVINLRYSHGARELLIDKTLGDEDAITIGTVKEILSEIEQGTTNRIIEAHKNMEKEKDELEKTLAATVEEKANSNDQKLIRVAEIARKRAKFGTLTIAFIVCGIISFLLYEVALLNEAEISRWVLKAIGICIPIIITILGLINVNLLPIFKNIYKTIYSRSERKIIEKYYPELIEI